MEGEYMERLTEDAVKKMNPDDLLTALLKSENTARVSGLSKELQSTNASNAVLLEREVRERLKRGSIS
jgi:hypothetical protein